MTGELEDRLKEAVLRIADFELGGVHADREAAAAGVDVVARKGPLVALGEAPIVVKGER